MHTMVKIVTMSELAEYLKVHPSTIYRLLKYSDIPAFKLGSDWRFNLDSINEWLLKLETAHRKPAEPIRPGNGRKRADRSPASAIESIQPVDFKL